ncbi:type VI secretion system-associated FHA domain protein TagH [Thaumasiovibrio sp. DFM-14]|uniref:type VI secretion system-associated FHA domain protein TagH n=1 Tax=Thaumasiovibrio sp. DFM-14 TaxID=3384792 RepID=UPI0039A3D6AF
MDLTLSIVSYHKFTSEMKSVVTISAIDDSSAFLFGRAADCDWVLPDPERVVSGVHGKFQFRQGHFYLVDCSTNGVFLNRNVMPIGKSKRVMLSDGDLITFGDYEVEVALTKLEDGIGEPLQTRASSASSDSQQQENRQSSAVCTAAIDNTVESQATLKNDFLGELEDSFDYELSGDFDEIPDDWDFLNQPTALAVTNNDLAATEATLDVASPILDQSPKKSPVQVSRPAASRQASSSLTHGVEKAPRSKSTTHTTHARVVKTAMLNAMSATDESPTAAFLRGMGIPEEMVPVDNTSQWWFNVGQSMQLMMTGLMDTLHHRASFKQSNRLNHTAFQRQENNPLKFSATFEDAVHNLFNRTSVSFLTHDRAITEAFNDIEKHENAMMSGVDGVVNGVMKMLHPDNSVTSLETTGILDRMNPSRIDARQWNLFQQRYFELESEMQSNEKPFYLEDFVKAYETSLK